MKLGPKRAEGIKRFLIEEGFTEEEAKYGVAATGAAGDVVDDPIAEARREAQAFRRDKMRESVPAGPVPDEIKLVPCSACSGTGFIEVTRGWTVGGVKIAPDDGYAPALAKCPTCHGVRFVRPLEAAPHEPAAASEPASPSTPGAAQAAGRLLLQ